MTSSTATSPAVSAAPVANSGELGARAGLIGLSRAELADFLAGLGEAPFRAKQLWHWIYNQGVSDFAAMTSLGKPLRQRLGEHADITRPEIASEQISHDGTRKWLLRLADGNLVETVFIPEEDRGTLCVSSQVGCTLTCRFCHTGTQRLVRNLTAGEITAQVLVARDRIGEWPTARPGAKPPDAPERWISNIVLMGMGEPLYNFDNVARALDIVTDNEGIQISKRRITLSTAGVVPMMETCGRRLGVNLAVSLHATTDALRDEIVPLNRKYPIAALLKACREYPRARNSNRITFEYVMLKDVNDSAEDARRLLKLIEGIPAKVNLIPFNPWPGAPYECADDETIERFAGIVMKAGYASPVRTPRGRDILAACGQLKSASERPSKSRLVRESQTPA
ncbi:MAG: 23S rRNA (adenine(2503)-C(2))-methyltransferase RlmN [Alphaproteobacteria bacterium]